jgi:hypothetical protein
VDYDAEGKGITISDLPLQDVSPAFWTLKGIDFESSAAQNGSAHYCNVSFRTFDVLSVFPGEQETLTVERVGDSYPDALHGYTA